MTTIIETNNARVSRLTMESAYALEQRLRADDTESTYEAKYLCGAWCILVSDKESGIDLGYI